MENLLQKFYEKYNETDMVFIRNHIRQFDWSNRLIGIKGSRGVGKTTMLLHHDFLYLCFIKS